MSIVPRLYRSPYTRRLDLRRCSRTASDGKSRSMGRSPHLLTIANMRTRLAAILAADGAGYSRLMSKMTMPCQGEHLPEAVDPARFVGQRQLLMTVRNGGSWRCGLRWRCRRPLAGLVGWCLLFDQCSGDRRIETHWSSDRSQNVAKLRSFWLLEDLGDSGPPSCARPQPDKE